MREPPSLPDTKRRTQNQETRTYRFLTPVMGGGVHVREHEKHGDSVTPVRGASVRGQLRFWWRACNPAGLTTVEALREREGQVWGSTSIASPIVVEVVQPPRLPTPLQVFEYNARGRLVSRPGMREIAYGAFSLQPSREAQKKGAAPGVLLDYGAATFSLRFTYPAALKNDLFLALWAWETLGGLGARTRRGFGAITRADQPTRRASEIERMLAERRRGTPIPYVPMLSGSRFGMGKHQHPTALAAWKEALGVLQHVRQGVGIGRNPPAPHSLSPAGRSRWPEADELRRRISAAPKHQRPVVSVERFPRAVFGLPIVFHFHPGSPDEPGSQGDPDRKPLQLQPEISDRFASPVVLRPLPDGTTFRAAALVLASPVPETVLVAGEDRSPVEWRLDPALAGQIPALARPGKPPFTDPLELFLAELTR